MRGYKF